MHRGIREEALMREIQEQMGWNSDEMAIDDILKVRCVYILRWWVIFVIGVQTQSIASRSPRELSERWQ